MNDRRNDSEYSCVIILREALEDGMPGLADIMNESDPTFLYIAGEYNGIV